MVELVDAIRIFAQALFDFVGVLCLTALVYRDLHLPHVLKREHAHSSGCRCSPMHSLPGDRKPTSHDLSVNGLLEGFLKKNIDL